jgi:hypothetical protein
MLSLSFFRVSALTTVAIAALLVVAGCKSGGEGGQAGDGTKAVESFTSVRNNLATADTQIDSVLQAMDLMAGPGDLSLSFKTYVDRVDALDKTAQGARKRAEDMRANFKAYQAKWEKEVEEMTDPDISASMQARRDAVRANFAKVSAAGQKVRDAYGPFITRLRSIQKAVQLDMTPAGVKGIESARLQAYADSATLKSAVAAMQKELDSIRAGMSTTPTVK